MCLKCKLLTKALYITLRITQSAVAQVHLDRHSNVLATLSVKSHQIHNWETKPIIVYFEVRAVSF